MRTVVKLAQPLKLLKLEFSNCLNVSIHLSFRFIYVSYDGLWRGPTFGSCWRAF